MLAVAWSLPSCGFVPGSLGSSTLFLMFCYFVFGLKPLSSSRWSSPYVSDWVSLFPSPSPPLIHVLTVAWARGGPKAGLPAWSQLLSLGAGRAAMTSQPNCTPSPECI